MLGKLAIAALALLAFAGLAGAAPPVGGLTQPKGAAGCVANDADDNEDGCAVVPALGGPAGLAVSKDGRNVYVTIDGPGVLAFSRSPAGTLKPLPGKAVCISSGGSDGACTDGQRIPGARTLVVTPDGKAVIVAGESGVAALTRGVGGRLGQANAATACVTDDGSDGACADGTALNEVAGIAISPDGRSVYAAASGVDGVAWFARSGGALRQSGCITLTGAETTTEDDDGNTIPGDKVCGVGRALGAARGVAVSPNGRNVYVASSTDGLAVFARAASGALRQLAGKAGCVVSTDADENDGCATADAVEEVQAVAVSPDGKNVYAASSEAILSFTRNVKTGALARLAGKGACLGSSAGCTPARALSLLWSVAISPDGRNLYSVSDDGLGVFSRNPATGVLTQLAGRPGCETDEGGRCAQARSVIHLEQIALSGDGKNVYAGSPSRATIGIFNRQH